jgi:hypothetical protein
MTKVVTSAPALSFQYNTSETQQFNQFESPQTTSFDECSTTQQDPNNVISIDLNNFNKNKVANSTSTDYEMV